ncbi:Type II/IV secretion system secretin RcpA/CpaC, associated with Flp pilus assembly [hydrothermal vent metagenome]|uniref:Type II/IV secretion system secretin RcpA/CpaC, associated with Flp pilus assembly n=1 Tax=hydrothermal vent metagenome TaxID=652676 RepID=A0A3B0RBT2_9ZZZZ
MMKQYKFFKQAILVLASFGLMLAMPASANEANLLKIKISSGGESAVSKMLDLPLNKAAVIELPEDARDVLVSNPEIVDAVIRTPRRIYVLGVAVGQTNVFFFRADGTQLLNLEISVAEDIRDLQSTIQKLLPNARIEIDTIRDSIILSGSVPNAGQAAQAMKIARTFVETPENVISMLTITGKEQVMLKVRVVEMQRTLTKQLGIDLSVVGRLNEVALSLANPAQFSLAGRFLGGSAPTLGVNYTNPALGVTSGITGVGAGIRALERVGLIRTLAEPNLTAITGESANFLAGGEFPVPTGRDRNGNITIEYKKFGVGLGFTPLVVSEGRISLRLSTEVSELSNLGALSLGQRTIVDSTGQTTGVIDGLTLPALKVRKAETTVELPSGGSMVIAGLIQQQTKQAMEGIPGAKDIPILGALFRSRDFLNDETELVIVVTPYLVDPTHPESLAEPGQGYETASDLSTLLLGRLNKVYRAPGADTTGKSWTGPVGYSLD